MKCRATIWVCLFLMGLSLPAQAQEKFYIGGRLGGSATDGFADTDLGLVYSSEPRELFPGVLVPQLERAGIDGALFDDSDEVQSVYAGFRFNETINVEFGVSDLGDYAPSNRPAESSTRYSGVSIRLHQIEVRAKFQLPLFERFSLNGVVGLSRTAFDATGIAEVLIFIPECCAGYLASSPLSDPSDESGFLWGAGFDWKFGRRMILGVNAIRHDIRVMKLDAIEMTIFFDL